MRSTESDNKFVPADAVHNGHPKRRSTRRRKGSGFPHAPAHVDVVRHVVPMRNTGEPEGLERKKSKEVSDKQNPLKIGDMIHYATYYALTGSDLLENFLERSKTINRLRGKLNRLNRRSPKFYPNFQEFMETIEIVGRDIAEFVSPEIKARRLKRNKKSDDTDDPDEAEEEKDKRRTDFLIEPSFTPVHSRFMEAGLDLDDKVRAGVVDEYTIVEFSGPYILNKNIDTQGFSEETLDQLHAYGNSSTVYADREHKQIDVASDSVRMDFIQVDWEDTPENADMNDLMRIFKKIQKGKGKRRHMLNFDSWANNDEIVNGVNMTAGEAFRLFIGKILAGQIKVTINEIKGHVTDFSYIHVDVDNSKGESPYVDAKNIDPGLMAALGGSMAAFFNMARNFVPELDDIGTAIEFVHKVEVKICEASLGAAFARVKDPLKIPAEDIRRGNTTMKICRARPEDIIEEIARREEHIRENGGKQIERRIAHERIMARATKKITSTTEHNGSSNGTSGVPGSEVSAEAYAAVGSEK
jgi:hypothetical protein